MRRVVSIVALAFAGMGVACKAKPDAQAAAPEVAVDTATPEPVAPEPAPVAAMPRSCDDSTLRGSGIGAMEVGDTHDVFRTACIVMSDSTEVVASDGIVRGTVVVSVNGAPVNVHIADGRVYRLTVTDPTFRTLDGLGPGFPIARMLDLPGAVVLEGDHDLSVVVNAHCGLYFRITKPAAVQNLSRWSDVVRALPEGTPVERVVVHGCRGA